MSSASNTTSHLTNTPLHHCVLEIMVLSAQRQWALAHQTLHEIKSSLLQYVKACLPCTVSHAVLQQHIPDEGGEEVLHQCQHIECDP